MSSSAQLALVLERARQRSLVVGVTGLALCGLGALQNATQFYRSYLFGYVFWTGIALGCVAITMLHHLTSGGWGFVIRRLLESGSRTLVPMAVLFLPLAFGLSRLYTWARPESVAADPLLQQKHLFLNVPFFLGRTAFYFLIWILLAYFLNRWSLEQDRTQDPALVRRFEALSGPGLVVYGFTVTFASVDWVMSLEPRWFSTIYGLLFMVAQVLAALALVIVGATLLSKHSPLEEVISPGHFHDLGNLLFAFVLLWAYLSFSQYLIIWSGNLREEIPWYITRTSGGWTGLAVFLIVFHFAVPFLLLLSRTLKRRMRVLAVVAAAMILVSLVDLYWLLAPAFAQEGPRPHWMDLMSPIGIGGVWIWAFLTGLRGKPLLPLGDPRFQKGSGHGH